MVKKAVSAKDKSRDLAVKIVPYDGDAIKRKKIEKEINIIRLLPDHHNLVRVHPIKCFSENNFYIFMECCKDGTLVDLLRMPRLLDEERVFDIFWQLMNGYRVLWENGILHQDLKLANVLLKKGVLKITDFGFSILAERYIPSLTREGTLQYMSLEKLT